MMKNSHINKIEKYWEKYYNKKEAIRKNSNFSKFVISKLQKSKSLIDIGCGNGRDSFFFSKNKIKTLGIDNSIAIIKKNNLIIKKKKLKFVKFKKVNIDLNKNIYQKFDYIYVRFFLHAVISSTENSLVSFIKKIRKRNTLVFFEFRNEKDKIFKKGKNVEKNLFIFNGDHYRRIIITKKFIQNFKKLADSKLIYKRESKFFSATKHDKPHLTRLVFKLN